MKMKHAKTISLFSSSSSSSWSTLFTIHHLLLLLLLLFCLIWLTQLPTSTTVSAALILGHYSNETDRIALLDFKHRISSEDPHPLNSWNHSQHHCRWQGVSCGRRHQRVVALSLPMKGLVGTISPHIGNLTFLRDINLSSNALSGHIPGQIGRLFRLRFLDLSNNTLTGELAAANLSNCLQLKVIYLYRNSLIGKLPEHLSSLKKLLFLSLGFNQFSGGIPPAFGNLSSLERLAMHYNHLEGTIPVEITQCWRLKTLSLGPNNLNGTLSSKFFNMTSIIDFSMTQNSLQGTIPSYIGDTMPYLTRISIGGNKFHGTIPISFPNASKLQNLELSQNYFVGKVPDNIGKLTDLWRLNLEANLLGSNDPLNDFTFITSLSNSSNLYFFSIAGNRFEGKLPNAIANLSSKLTFLYLGENKLSGTIPIGIRNLGSLIILSMVENLLSGVIPSEIGDLQNLQQLGLSRNKFSGKIPPTLFNLSSLYALFMDHNNLDGSIPSSVGNFLKLNVLSLSSNRLHGSIPEEVFTLPGLSMMLDLSDNSLTGWLSPAVGKLKTLGDLYINGNKLSGRIPNTIGDCLSLEYLDMNGNLFEGKIPPSLASLKSIKYLDISNNKLSGEIPRELQTLPLLQYLNLSFNDLEGEVPTKGVFAEATNVSLLGNKKLCGGIPELKLPPCLVKKRKHTKHLMMILVIFTSVCVAAMVLASFIAFLTLHRRKDKREESTDELSKVEKHFRISYSELHQATEGFSETNLIGSGSFGSVYKGKFHQGGEQVVAVKVLDLLKNGASKSFLAECKVLRNIRHRNLVPILTCCSSCDFMGNDFKALVYKFMENGDLDTWLHPHSNGGRTTDFLSVLQRLNIIIDVASALQYLHNDCEPPVIHCDIKPNNILLDKDLTAHVGDFGLSRLYTRTIRDSSGKSSTLGLKGSIGYIAPEYGIGGNASTFGDVYSYGILLLEMFTAKRPTYDFSDDGCRTLCEYVEGALQNEVMKIVDPLLLQGEEESNHGIRLKEPLENPSKLVEIEEKKMDDFFISVFKIGIACASRSPMDRTNMKDVTRELQKIRNAFFA